jgi:polyhydroxyalkanoate synthase
MSDGALERKSAPASQADVRAGSSETGILADGSSQKRKRGRPRKAAPAEAEANAPPRKRGRPRKHPLPDPNVPKRKRGRPRKVTQIDAPAPALTQPAPLPQPTIASQPPRIAFTQSENVAQARKPAPAALGDVAGRSAERPQAKPETKAETRPEGASASPGIPTVDFNALAVNMARVMEEGGKALAAYIRPIENGQTNPDIAEHVEDAVKTFGHVAEYWLADPARAVEAQTKLSGDFITLWGNTLRRFTGENVPPVAEPEPGDKRFADPEWKNNPLFDFLRQAYVITTRWANEMVEKAEAVDPATREKANFYLRQVAGALSPSNFVGTNPELLRTTFAENAENLVRGMKMLAEDIEAGKGALKIRQSDATKFQLGRDLAMTPGKVVYRNDLMELIQYTPTTPDVFKRPLLIVPPWINKFYVLDLNPEKSFVRFCVENGLTVFVISWVNPDERHADKSFEDYIREGVFEALDAIHEATGERKATAIGYCVGGTLLAIALALMAATGDDRIDSATLFTTQVDFTDAGELKLFVDSARIASLEEKMRQTGYLEGAKMASAFNMLRPNELIWGYFVNNYLKGKEPMPFDLLTWNSDSTRMPAANHSFYLRNCYLDNTLAQGKMTMANHRLELKNVTIPIYDLAAREDHIAPARSVFTGAKLFGGEVRYVLAGSGHIAGVINPARKPKYQYWIGGKPAGTFDEWFAGATEHPGTWWLDWIKWIEAQAPEKVPARQPGEGKLKAICDAPGEYVLVKA